MGAHKIFPEGHARGDEEKTIDTGGKRNRHVSSGPGLGIGFVLCSINSIE